MNDTNRRVPYAVVLALIFAGCSARSGDVSTVGIPLSPTASQRSMISRNVDLSKLSRGWLSEQAKTGSRLLFVADQTGQTIYIFPQNGLNPAPIGAITQGVSGPEGLFVDKRGSLYVCNFGTGTVTVYSKGSISPSKTLAPAGVAPIDVVAGRDGTVYVADFNDGKDGHVFEYAGGSATPTTTISLAGYPEGLALDHDNNLYVAYQKPSSAGGTVLKFKPGAIRGRDLRLPIVLVGGAAIDSQDNLLVVDQSVPNPHIDVFPPGAKTPSRKIGGFPLAFDIALNSHDNILFVTQPEALATVFKVAYPQGVIRQQITNTIGSAFGVATSPDGSP